VNVTSQALGDGNLHHPALVVACIFLCSLCVARTRGFQRCACVRTPAVRRLLRDRVYAILLKQHCCVRCHAACHGLPSRPGRPLLSSCAHLIQLFLCWFFTHSVRVWTLPRRRRIRSSARARRTTPALRCALGVGKDRRAARHCFFNALAQRATLPTTPHAPVPLPLLPSPLHYASLPAGRSGLPYSNARARRKRLEGWTCGGVGNAGAPRHLFARGALAAPPCLPLPARVI